MESKFCEMIALAREYCQLIEQIEENGSESWLVKMSMLLPRIHASVATMGAPKDRLTANCVFCPEPDLDSRFDMFAQLRTILGKRDSYWLEFDVFHDERSMSGSLADDFTDIYFELQHGLKLLETNPDKAAETVKYWQSGYYIHWGQHVVDAERHLYGLRSRDYLAAS